MNPVPLQKLQAKFGDGIVEAHEFRGESTIVVRRECLVDVCRFLRDEPDLRYDLLVDLCGIDMYTPVKRFGVIYNVYSLKHRHRIRLKAFADEDQPHMPSVTGVWRTANWHERETYDMFGIVFDGHPDPRRIYMQIGRAHV